jgi:colanic acid/amylovoran biosynthesis protein
MRRVLIVNAYATRNHGDAAIIQGLIAILRDAGAAHVAVAARTWHSEEEAWRRLGADETVPPLAAIHDVPGWTRAARPLLLAYVCWVLFRAALGSVIRRPGPSARPYLDADLVVSAGGGYLGGPKAGINFVKVANIWFARSVRRPCVLAPMTISPPRGLVRPILRWGLQGARIFVRDAPSHAVMDGLGLRSQVAPDLAFRAPVVRAAMGRSADSATTSHGVLCWAPRSYRPDQDAWEHRESLERRCIEAVSQVIASHDLRLRFIPQVSARDEDDDRGAIARLAAALPSEATARTEIAPAVDELDQAIGQFADCDVLLASRLHATILAAAVGVPSLSIAYEPKVTGVLGEIGLAERAVKPDDSWASAELAERLERLLEPGERDRSMRAIADAAEGFEALEAAFRRALDGSARAA